MVSSTPRCLNGSVSDAVRALRTIPALAQRDPYRGPWADGDSEVLDIKNFLSALPTGWLDAATAATPAGDGPLEQYLRSSGLLARHFSRVPTQRELEVECGFVGGLGWYLGTNPVSVSELTVSQATLLQSGPLFETRLRYHQGFVSCVAPPGVRLNPVNVDRCCKAIAAAQRHLWKLKWDNAFK